MRFCNIFTTKKQYLQLKTNFCKSKFFHIKTEPQKGSVFGCICRANRRQLAGFYALQVVIIEQSLLFSKTFPKLFLILSFMRIAQNLFLLFVKVVRDSDYLNSRKHYNTRTVCVIQVPTEFVLIIIRDKREL